MPKFKFFYLPKDPAPFTLCAPKGGAGRATPAVASLPSEVFLGALAQLVERFNGIEEVSGSIPLCSTYSKSTSYEGLIEE